MLPLIMIPDSKTSDYLRHLKMSYVNFCVLTTNLVILHSERSRPNALNKKNPQAHKAALKPKKYQY